MAIGLYGYKLTYASIAARKSKNQHAKKTAQSIAFSRFFNADDRGRTGTGISSHGILSPGRLPVPPHRQISLLNLTTKVIIANFIIFVNSFSEKNSYK